jgi:hypothetical protein
VEGARLPATRVARPGEEEERLTVMPYDPDTVALMDEASRLVAECQLHDRQNEERRQVIANSHHIEKDFTNYHYKTYENPPLRQQSYMSDADAELWNIWVRSEIRKALDAQPIFTQQQIDTLKFAFDDERQETIAENKALHDKIAALEKELDALRVNTRGITAAEARKLAWLRGEIGKRDDDAAA